MNVKTNLNPYNRRVEKYLFEMYSKERDKGQIKDLFEGLIELPSGYINNDGFLSLLQDVKDRGYTNDFLNVTIKIAQAVEYHNSMMIEPKKDFSFVQDGVYLNREDILAICKNTPNPREQAMILGVFEGLMGKDMIELLEIEPTDIDVETNEIYIKSRHKNFQASPELIGYLKKARAQKDYMYLNNGKEPSIVPLEDNGTMLKKLIIGRAAEQRLIYQSLMRLCSVLKFKSAITYRHIRNCGRKYYLEELSKFWNVDPDTALKTSKQVRAAYFERFDLSYVNLKQLMRPIENLIARP